MKRKVIVAVLCLLVVSMSACGKTADAPVSTEQTQQTEEVVTENIESETVSTEEVTEVSNNTIGNRLLTREELDAILESYIATGESSIDVPYTENEDGTRNYSVAIETGDMIVTDGDRTDILNSRTEEEMEADAADGWVGIELHTDEATGQSIGIDLISGAIYKIGDMTADEWQFNGDTENNRNDAITYYRLQHPSTDYTDDEIAHKFGH